MDADAKNQAIAILKAYEDGKHRRYELLFAVTSVPTSLGEASVIG
jgi:hypothetical protein